MDNFNSSQLSLELKQARILFSGCNSKGIVWDIDGVTEIQTRSDIATVIANHVPILKTNEQIQAEVILVENAKKEASLVMEFRNLTPAQAAQYIENNVTTLATAKTVLKLMVRILVALRNERWPDL